MATGEHHSTFATRNTVVADARGRDAGNTVVAGIGDADAEDSAG